MSSCIRLGNYAMRCWSRLPERWTILGEGAVSYERGTPADAEQTERQTLHDTDHKFFSQPPSGTDLKVVKLAWTSCTLLDIFGFTWRGFAIIDHTHAFAKLQIGVCWSHKPTTEPGCNASHFNKGALLSEETLGPLGVVEYQL